MKTFRVFFAVLAALVFSCPPCLAASSAVLHVSATIRPWVVFKAVQNTYSYTVTPADLQRGYVDLAGSITLDIKTNIRREITVKFSSENGERIQFRVGTGGNYFENECALYTEHGTPTETISRNIDSRIILTTHTKEGVYPFNVSMLPEI